MIDFSFEKCKNFPFNPIEPTTSKMLWVEKHFDDG
jgi:hypothetical protein